MSHGIHLLVYGLLTCCLPLLFSACSDDDDIENIDEDEYNYPPRGPIDTDETVSNSTTILGSIPAELEEAFDIRFTNQNSDVTEETDVLIVPGSAITSFTEEAVAVYENNGIIVITQPDIPATNSWFEQTGWPFRLPTDQEDTELYAFSQSHQYIMDDMHDEITANEHLNGFVSWINQSLVPAVSATPGTGETAIDKLIAAQTITHTYSYHLRVTEATPLWSDKDEVYGNGTFTVKYSIYPVYVFQGQQNSGDYYIVTAEYTAESANMCQMKDKYHMWIVSHGLVQSHLCGFYLEDFTVESSIIESSKSKTPLGEFPVGYSPVPLTTSSGSTTYSTGLSWSIGADVAVGGSSKGIEGSFTVKGGVTISNSQTRTIADVNIMNQSTKNISKYKYAVRNLPGPVAGHISTPPLVSVSNATLLGSWIWRVPQTTDRSTKQFYLNSKISLNYGSCHLYSSKLDFGSQTTSTGTSESSSSIIPPSRIPTGLIKINNSYEKEYISDIEIIGKNGKVEYSTVGKGSIEPGKVFLRYVPIGEYTIRFKMGPNALSTKTYVSIETANIQRGEEYEMNSEFDFEEQK